MYLEAAHRLNLRRDRAGVDEHVEARLHPVAQRHVLLNSGVEIRVEEGVQYALLPGAQYTLLSGAQDARKMQSELTSHVEA